MYPTAPAVRSRVRRSLGRLYFTCKRRLLWHFSGVSFARALRAAPLPHDVFTADSLIMRPLRNVDMHLQENKKINLALAVGRISGILLRPGETFSFWRLVGRPTRSKGYKDGLTLHQGHLETGVGGGLCQLSNLIYWMTLHTPLRVIERRRHSYDVFPDVGRNRPFGSGATVAYNYVDLQIHNPTAQTFQLRLWLDETHLQGEWRSDAPPQAGYRVFEKNHRFEPQPWGGYLRRNELYRLVSRQDSRMETEEFITANDALMLYNPSLTAAGPDLEPPAAPQPREHTP